jgi:peptidoglycan/xylan/chitin deacetylase (PgdA/CDA1 family)
VAALRVVPASVVNLTVHGIGPAARDLEPGEDRIWVGVQQFERVLDAVVGRPDVHLTFDDGNSSDVEIALPRLVERGLSAEFFVLVGRLGEPGRLDLDGVTELLRAGMAVGSHGWAHRDWRRVDPTQADEEIIQANRRLSEIIGRPVTRVAIPFGSYDGRVLARLRKASITRAYNSDGGRARATAWLQARNSLHRDMDAGWITAVLDARPSLRARARGLAARTVKRFRR